MTLAHAQGMPLGKDSLSDNKISVTVKTNAMALGMLIANAGVELGFGDRFSLHIPFYYSGTNYFSSHTKFRILGTQPEFRYWTPLLKDVSVAYIWGWHHGISPITGDGAIKIRTALHLLWEVGYRWDTGCRSERPVAGGWSSRWVLDVIACIMTSFETSRTEPWWKAARRPFSESIR